MTFGPLGVESLRRRFLQELALAGLCPPPRPSRGPPAGATWVAFNGDDEAEAGPAVFGNPGFFSVFSSHCFFQSACRDMGLAPSGLILSDKPGLVLPT